MHNTHHTPAGGWLLRIGLILIVLSFMALSLAVTATGTARFAGAMGYPVATGYVVGAVFDVAKALLPVALLMLLGQRAAISFAIIGIAWLGLVIYSALATQATVGMAIGSIERAGTWKREGRANIKAELVALERRLKALAEPKMPRPAATVREALAGEKVPPGVWRHSQECLNIRRSGYFQKACANVLQLRRELAAAEDYAQLNTRVRALRESLAAAPPVATSDPLPEAFAVTIGRLLAPEGRVGVALLVTIVIEIMSCFGLVGLTALREGHKRGEVPLRCQALSGTAFEMPSGGTGGHAQLIPAVPLGSIPQSSLSGADIAASGVTGRDGRRGRRSNGIPLVGGAGRRKPRAHEVGNISLWSVGKGRSLDGSHTRAFVRDCLQRVEGISVGASDLRAAYERWCVLQGKVPLSQQKLGVGLRALATRNGSRAVSSAIRMCNLSCERERAS